MYNSLYYKGYIARFITNYQFNKDLSIRLVSEYNEFDNTLFIQPPIEMESKSVHGIVCWW
jgi:hypothetical protein